jgi:hypothetical protein
VAKTVQAPEHDQVELLLVGFEQQLLKGGSVSFAA